MKTDVPERSTAEERPLRARDGIVTGARQSRGLRRGQLPATWVLVTPQDESVEDFFLESPFGPGDAAAGEDPVAWICRAVGPDGTVRLGEIDLETDRFVSEVLSDDLDEEIRRALRERRP